MKQYLDNRTPYWWLKTVTTIMGVAYALMFFGKLIRSYATLQASGLDVDLAVSNNPQSMIALSLLMVMLTIWFLRGSGKLAVAFFLYVALLGFFGYWAYSTRAIKVNTGLKSIPGSDSISNIWFGATWWLDPIVLMGTVAMAILSGRLLWQNYKFRQANRVTVSGDLASSHTRT